MNEPRSRRRRGWNVLSARFINVTTLRVEVTRKLFLLFADGLLLELVPEGACL